MQTFTQKTVVITGAGSGIGRALAHAFAAEGARLALNDYRAEALEHTCAICRASGASVFAKTFDVSQRSEMEQFARDTVAQFGSVHIAINNAGVGLGDYRFHEMDLQYFERVMAVNFYGVVYGSYAFIPYLLQEREAALVNISSVFGLTGIGGSAAYCASKFAVYGFTLSLMNEYRDTGLRIHSVHPGGIRTEIGKNSLDYASNPSHDAFQKHFLKIPPERAAATILRGIRRGEPRILIGSEAWQLDLSTRLFPVWGNQLVNSIIRRKMKNIQNR
ncbi:MAG: SDR family oxidoreductase [Chitinophagales bacterium]|nr:SDR family oxidoreductase [Chitinophagales bacterium]